MYSLVEVVIEEPEVDIVENKENKNMRKQLEQ